jgi:hypothetical protein
MRKVSSWSSSRRKATFALAAIAAAAVLGVGAALAHTGDDAVQTATRGFKGISNVDHSNVPAGTWMFEVVAMDGKVMDLTLAIKSNCIGGEFYFNKQIKKPTLGTQVTTPKITANPNADGGNLCSQVAFPGAGNSITVRVTHP